MTPSNPSLEAWTVFRKNIPWYAADGPLALPLGRNVNHDSRNLWYRHRRAAPVLVTRLHTRNIPILDQGNVGSCTGDGEVGCIGSSPLWESLSAEWRAKLNQPLAYQIYSGAEDIDGDGPYPPNDNGSSGPSAAKAALRLGLISGYTHCLSLTDILDALQRYPVSIGMNWYDSFDSPLGTNALLAVTPNAAVRGAHEPMLRGVDMEAKTLFGDNSWGEGWGSKGSFTLSFGTMDRLLHEQGDGTVSLPLSQPPPPPIPPPGPFLGDDALLWSRTAVWAGGRHVGQAKATATALRAWAAAKKFT